MDFNETVHYDRSEEELIKYCMESVIVSVGKDRLMEKFPLS